MHDVQNDPCSKCGITYIRGPEQGVLTSLPRMVMIMYMVYDANIYGRKEVLKVQLMGFVMDRIK